ncbi:hypothetical protein B0F90DRAFT_1816200 [Multifurca ochricompacta]|uniref:Uncharacterized protein n=1 Tax=Multifurca ochricompacta TaxID=376703 RepID=A0AAD4M658_9AGAM|nr:hypothetical protein B0F90DRAFT_1816200 [Multifurca ochricompacta]
MSPKNIAPVSGLAEVSGSGLLIANSLIRAAKNVKIYRSQCDELSRRCLELVSALRDHSPGLEGTRAQQAVDEVERVLTRILEKVNKWGELGKMRSFVKQTEIKMGLDESYRELHTCSMQFNISLQLYASNRNKELEEIRKRDHDELIEMITRVLHDKNLLKITLATSTREDAHSVGLKEADFGETQEMELQEDFGELRGWVEGLPPMVDLSGSVVRTSEHAVATGGSQDIYTGEWTGKEVALGYPRNQTRSAQERFKRQVEIWRTLRHPNILQLLGIAYIGDFVYSVSPYMEFGNVMRYLEYNPGADRVFLLSETASDERPNIWRWPRMPWDFGSARVEEVPATEAFNYGSPRWLAPELMTNSSYVPTTRATDVWSFGMLCIEIFTEKVPFSHIQNEAYVPLVIREGQLPTRPENSITTRGLDDTMWKLTTECWKRDPESRPSMSEVREAIQNALPLRSCRPSLSNSRTHRHSSSLSSVSSSPANARPSLLTMSRPPRITGLTPPTAPLPLPSSLTREDAPLSEQSNRGPSPASFPLHKSPILKDKPLSSSPPSPMGLSPSAPRPIPSPVPSPLSSSYQKPRLSTTPESRTSVSPISDRADWPFTPLPPLSLRKPSTSSGASMSLLLEPVQGGADQLNRAGSVSAISVHSTDGGPTTNISGGLLEAAIQDPEPVLRRAADGSVEAGTLEGLVDRLIQETHNRAKDNEVQRIFLVTYRLFTTAEDLFKILKKRFEEMGDVLRVSLSIGRSSIRYSILLFLRTWLKAEGEFIGRELLSSIKEFALSVSGSETMREVTREIVDLSSEKMDAIVTSPILPSQSRLGTGLPSFPEQVKAIDIAISLSVIEGDSYGKITHADYIAHLRGSPITKHIELATKANNRLVNWVKRKVLSPEDVNRRANSFRLFVLVAEECRKLQNFSSMSAILAALQSATLASSTTSQLILTRESKLTKNESNSYAYLKAPSILKATIGLTVKHYEI